MLANVAYWIDEFHLDGLRIDATQGLFDNGPRHILRDIVAADPRGGRRPARAGHRRERAAARDLLRGREPRRARIRHALERRLPPRGRRGRHRAIARPTTATTSARPRSSSRWSSEAGSTRGSGTCGRASDAAAPRWTSPPASFVSYLQNHDQIANSARGDRLHALTTPGRLRALTALQLLGPATPLLFQGQEFAASSPFLYFSDPQARGRRASSARGARSSVKQFPSLATEEMQARVPDPTDRETFDGSKLDHAEREAGRHAEALALHRDLLRLRRDDPTFRAGQRPGAVDGAVLGPEALVLRWFDPQRQGDDRLLLVNLGAELRLAVAAEPLLAPPEGQRWQVLWSSEDPRYGGAGTAEPETEAQNWRLAGHAAVLWRRRRPTATSPQPVRNGLNPGMSSS